MRNFIDVQEKKIGFLHACTYRARVEGVDLAASVFLRHGRAAAQRSRRPARYGQGPGPRPPPRKVCVTAHAASRATAAVGREFKFAHLGAYNSKEQTHGRISTKRERDGQMGGGLRENYGGR